MIMKDSDTAVSEDPRQQKWRGKLASAQNLLDHDENKLERARERLMECRRNVREAESVVSRLETSIAGLLEQIEMLETLTGESE
jgi:predicted  nucleic acid-binding Zn-ribbon protein